ncbi:MAG: hypothetical protein LBR26_12470 [Prevotella sp.]|jgi:uncharacterized protein YPO0396|nr:hypothetical protein [Prevotella sp.]
MIEYNIDNTQIGFRLQYMELLNWGTFHNKIWKITPNGNNSLLTGEIGSGKSTVVDALTCLIVPHHKIVFNKAAGAEGKERTMASYIRGEYKNTKAEYNEINNDAKRKSKAISLRYTNDSDTTFTVVLANFHNAGYENDVTLAQIYWIENEKIQKLFIVSFKPLTIKKHFSGIENGKSLKQKIKTFSNIGYVGDSFSEYSQQFRLSLGMNSDKAIDLFYQTVSMKEVKNLTSFVREQMLEQTDVKTQIEELKKRFEDLNRAYYAVLEARKQRDTLFPLVKLETDYTKYRTDIEEIENILSAIPGYFATKKIVLLEKEIANCEAKLNKLENDLTQLGIDLEAKRDAQTQIKQDIRNNGGARLEQIESEIKQREKNKNAKRDKHNQYISLATKCELPSANSDKTFYANIKTAQQKVEYLKDIQATNSDKLGILSADLRIVNENIGQTDTELQSLKNRKNQIPLAFLDVRQKMIDDLQMDEKEIPFAGELIKVKDDEKQWEGALERLLHGFGISLLVPEKHYKAVSSYINRKRLLDKNERGVKLDYFPVPANIKYNYNAIDADSVVNKIEIKGDTNFEDWLQSDLEQHFNLKCVSIDDFQKIKQDAITIEGQYKKGKKHTKDDRKNLWDKKTFVLGWSNIEKIKAVEESLAKLKIKQETTKLALDKLKMEMDGNVTLNTNLNLLLAHQNWNELNWQDEAKEIEKLKLEEKDIKTSNNVLQTLQNNLTRIAKEIAGLEKEQREKGETIGGLKKTVEDHVNGIEACKSAQTTISEIEALRFYPKINTLIANNNLTVKNIDRIQNELVNNSNDEERALNRKSNQIQGEIIKVMQNYKNEFPALSNELSVETDALPEFIKQYNEINKNGLPEHENRFKELLNKNTIDDIRVFDVKLDTHSKQINNKIKEINRHLREIEFNKGTYIELSSDRNPDKEISDFKKSLKDCYADILDTSDAYTEDRFNLVKAFLDRFKSNDTKDIEWTKKVTDVRNWYLFSASEKYMDDDSEKEFYSDTAGKSGGQKEKLAYTILASALAYQFGLSFGEPRSKSFRFVVIDEAFGRGSDISAQFGLELFKKLNLQILVITPLQKINIIENYINTVHIVSNTEGNNSEIQFLTTEEYKREKQRRNIMQTIESTAQ